MVFFYRPSYPIGTIKNNIRLNKNIPPNFGVLLSQPPIPNNQETAHVR